MRSSRLSEWLRGAAEEAGRLPRPRLPDTDIVIVYSPGAEPPAYQLYLGYLHAGRRATLAGAVEAAFHVLPYREDVAGVVVYTRGGRDSQALVVAEHASTLGVHTVLVGPELHPAYEEKAEIVGAERVTVGGGHPVMTATVASLRWAPEPPSARAERLRGEAAGLASAAEWVEGRFGQLIEALRGATPQAVYYTPAMASAAFYTASLARGRTGSAPHVAPMEYLGAAVRGSQVVAMLTELEASAVKDSLVAARVRGVSVLEVSINTDPLTAGLYGMLLSAAAYGEML